MNLRPAFLFVVLIFVCWSSVASATLLDSIPPHKKHHRGDTVGVVNSVLITLFDFKSLLDEKLRAADERGEIKDKKATNEQFTSYVNETWQEMEDDILIQQEIDRRHLNATNEEALEALIHSPNKEIKAAFMDSVRKFDTGLLRREFLDPKNDSESTIILNATKVDLERRRLVVAIAGKTRSEAARRRAFAAWLEKARSKAIITDRRVAFGYY